jgi:BMFP domain-containing protein YqiC
MKIIKSIIVTSLLAFCSITANVTFAEEVLIEKINVQLNENLENMIQEFNKNLEKELSLTVEKVLLKQELKKAAENYTLTHKSVLLTYSE